MSSTNVADARPVGSDDDEAAFRVRFCDVTKTFEGTRALDSVSFDIRSGEIHALLGANGAGKSTIIKVLAGVYTLNSGSIQVLDDTEHSRQGVAFIHQDLALVPDMTVAENVALVAGYPSRAGRIDWREVRKQARAALAGLGASGIDVDMNVGLLSRAEQSLVAIARALQTECATLVLDEPTASLPAADVERLLATLLDLARSGVSILYVTHRLDEVQRIADWVTILRDGRVVADCQVRDISETDIITAIAGAASTPHVRSARDCGATVLSVLEAKVTPSSGPFSFEVRAGEVLGLAGLRGSGQEEVGRALAGITPLHAGSYRVGPRHPGLGTVRDALRHGIGFATSRREQEALATTLTVRENFYLNPGPARSRNPFRVLAAERRAANKLSDEVRLRPAGAEAVVATLSGGNQQKVVLGRWLETSLSVLILEEPTMGIDVGARREIYALMETLTASGLAAVVVSSDFDELVTICDRVLVFDRGTVREEICDSDITVALLTQLASGGKKVL